MGLEDILPPPEKREGAEEATPEQAKTTDELVVLPDDPKVQSLNESETQKETTTPSVTTVDLTQPVSDTPVVPSQVEVLNTEASKESDSPLEVQSDVTDVGTIAEDTIPTPAVATTENSAKSKYDAVSDMLFARLAPVGVGDNLKILFYGPPGGTKSTSLNIDDCLIYNNDGGLSSILAWHEKSGEPLAKDCIALPFTTFTQATLLVDRLRNKDQVEQIKGVKVFAIDTLNKLSDKILMVNSKLRHDRLPESQKGASSPFDPQTEDYVKTNNEMFDYVEQLSSLPMNLVMVAHSRTTESKQYGVKIHPDFSEKLANKIEAMMDVVAYVEMKEDADGNRSPIFMFTTDGHTHAKNRLGLPDTASNVKYTEIVKRWEELKALQAAQ